MKLKELRKEKKITQNELAKIIKTTQSNYGKYELGQQEPDIQTLCKIADYFNVTLDYLCEHKTNTIFDYGFIEPEKKQAISILLKLPEKYFYEYFGRLQMIAESLQIDY